MIKIPMGKGCPLQNKDFGEGEGYRKNVVKGEARSL